MENVSCCKTPFKVILPIIDKCNFSVKVDGKDCNKCETNGKNYIFFFELEKGNHELKITCRPNNNSFGKLKFRFLPSSSKYLFIHLFAFVYFIQTFVYKIDLTVHKEAEITINIQKKQYTNFLYQKGLYLLPSIAGKHNLNIIKTCCEFVNKKENKELFCRQLILYTSYVSVYIIFFTIYSVFDIKNWNVDYHILGHTGASSFLICDMPSLIFFVGSYTYYLLRLIKNKNQFL